MLRLYIFEDREEAHEMFNVYLSRNSEMKSKTLASDPYLTLELTSGEKWIYTWLDRLGRLTQKCDEIHLCCYSIPFFNFTRLARDPKKTKILISRVETKHHEAMVDFFMEKMGLTLDELHLIEDHLRRIFSPSTFMSDKQVDRLVKQNALLKKVQAMIEQGENRNGRQLAGIPTLD